MMHKRAAAMAEKAKKEERLKELLAKRKPSDFDVDSIKAKGSGEAAPSPATKGQEELNQYAASLQKELLLRNDSWLKRRTKNEGYTNPGQGQWYA